MDKNLVIKLYDSGLIGLSQASKFTQLNLYEFLSLLKTYKIPVINYEPDDLEKEFKNISEKFRTKSFN